MKNVTILSSWGKLCVNSFYSLFYEQVTAGTGTGWACTEEQPNLILQKSFFPASNERRI
jgi:hypothetical protein